MAEGESKFIPDTAEPEKEEAEKPEEEKFSPERVLEMPPKELADFFSDLQEKGELEAFLKEAAENDALVAQFSYWEKWLAKDQRRLVDEVVAKKREVYGENSESLPLELEKKFTPAELHSIFSNLVGIQLTFGCSKGCPFCALDAVPGVREHIPYSQLANLFQKYGREIKETEPPLYWASEPSDYASKQGLEDKTYQDVHQLADEYAGYSPPITSKNIEDQEWLDFVGEQQGRVSLYGREPAQAEKIIQDQWSKKNMIRSVGEGREHSKGIGLSLMKEGLEEEKEKTGIVNRDGVLLSPRGLYNVVRVPISDKYPQGLAAVPLEKVTSEEIKVGESIDDAMREHVVEFRDLDPKIHGGEEEGVIFICGNGTEYVVKNNEDGIITLCEKYDRVDVSEFVQISLANNEVYDENTGEKIEADSKIIEALKTIDFFDLEHEFSLQKKISIGPKKWDFQVEIKNIGFVGVSIEADLATRKSRIKISQKV